MKRIVIFMMVVFTLGISNEAYSHGHAHGHNKNKHKHKKPKKQPKKKVKHCTKHHHHMNSCVIIPRGIDKIIINL